MSRPLQPLATRYAACRAVGLLPVTAAAVVATRVSFLAFPVGVVAVVALTAQSRAPETAVVAVMPLWVVSFVVTVALSVASDVVQLQRRARGRGAFVSAYSRGGRFWRLVLARTERC